MLRPSGACAVALLWLAASACAAPTQDTLVVRADDVSTSPQTPEASSNEAGATTSAPPPPLKMSSMEVRAEVALRYAHTSVVTRVRNPAAVAQEATFSLLLPDTAFISGFVMTLDGKDYKAYVKEKAEAKQEYDAAVEHGQGAAHISAKARDSNHFTVRVHVEPQSEARFNLTYEELLQRRNSLYNLAVNLHPGGVVPKLSVVVHVREGRRITQLRAPAVRTGNEIDPTGDDPQNPGAVVVRSPDEREATVTFEPDLAEQQRLIDLYTLKSRQSRARSSYPYVVEEQLEGGGGDATEGVLGQFVVQYDVEHSADGEIFLNDGYFVHFYSPPQLAPLNKHVVFVLDTSGSMMDRKIAQLREAMASILQELRPGDYFNIVEFASDTHVYKLEEAKSEPSDHTNFYWRMESQERNVTLVPPAAATPENIALAQTIVSRLNAAGGTNINEALVTALRLVRRGVNWSEETSPANSNSSTSTAAATAAAPDDSAPATKTDIGKGGAEPEPIIIFLTDGDATVGVLEPKRIHKKISELNTGAKRAAIFSLAFGEDADRGFLRKLSLRNEGFMRHIYEAADAAAQLRSFYRQVSSPLLADVKFVYPPEQVEEGSVTKQRFHTLYAGGETIVAGRVAHLPSDAAAPAYFTPTVQGFCGVQDDADQKEYRVTPRVPLVQDEASWGALERLWAYITIKQKLDERDAAADVADEVSTSAAQDNISPEKEALRLALKYSFVTPLTSLVVVKPNASSAVDAESVDKKQPFSVPSLANQYGILSAGVPGGSGGFGGAYAYSVPGIPAAGAPSSYASYSASRRAGSVAISPAPLAHRHLFTKYHDMSRVEPELAVQSYVPAPSYMPYHTSSARPATGSSETQPDSVATSSVELGLQQYAWATPLINASARVLTLQLPSGVARSYKLAATDDLTAQMEIAAPGEACTGERSEDGVCVYLTRCSSATNMSLVDYTSSLHCDLRGYAGVCCLKNEVLPPSSLLSTTTLAAEAEVEPVPEQAAEAAAAPAAAAAAAAPATAH